MDQQDEQMVTDLLAVLDTRARYAVEQRFGLHDGRKRSYREVGEELGVTAEAARRLVKRAVTAVRDQRRRSHRRRLIRPDPTAVVGADPPSRPAPSMRALATPASGKSALRRSRRSGNVENRGNDLVTFVVA